MKSLALILFCFVASLPAQMPQVLRGPYLQIGTPTSIVVRWRTDVPTDSVVTIGPSVGNLNTSISDGTVTTEHEVLVQGLIPETFYFYGIGDSVHGTLAGNDPDHVFKTAPPVGSKRRTRLWVIGDSGSGNNNARGVRDGYAAFAGATHTDLWLMLGDNAYPNGTDSQYQTAVFQNMYETMLRRTALWSTFGNHDAHSANSATQTGVYFDVFTLPTSGQAGGIPSGTEAYYSFDWANIHFVCLDSAGPAIGPNHPMVPWLQADLASTTQDWIIAFWHHPPYTKGTHDSDTETRLITMRTVFMPILESFGVDLVLTGHSHVYERSMLIDSHYGPSSTFDINTMALDSGSGISNLGEAYRKSGPGPVPHDGTVAVVNGASGTAGSGSLNHPIMIRSLSKLGSVVIDVEDQQLDLKYLDRDGGIQDLFTIVKGGVSPVVTTRIPLPTAANWSFEDTNTDLGTAWRQPGFDDSGWNTGNGPLGFGSSLVQTTVSSGSSGSVPPTTYFRTTFVLDGQPSEVEYMALSALYDDGFIAYLNGQEVARSDSMGTGTVGFNTLATNHGATGYETFVLTPAALPLLQQGTNVLAVEVHQRSLSSSDLVWDGSLVVDGRFHFLGPCAAGTVTSNGEPFSTLLVNGTDGGLGRSVDVGINQPVTLDVLQPPGNPAPAHFSISGFLGTPTAAHVFTLPLGLGDLCFPTALAGPVVAPLSFLLADNFGNPGALLPSTTAPYSFTNPVGLPFPFTFTFQGLIETGGGGIGLTNAVRLHIVP